MRNGMNRLAAVLGRRRRWVVAAWVAILLCALPFAAKQTDHLTGGGFDVPGSQSMAVSEALQRDFGSESNGVSVALKAEPGAGPGAAATAVGRVRREVATVDGVVLGPATAGQARAQLRRTGFAILPLQSELSPDELIDAATTMREDLDPG